MADTDEKLENAIEDDASTVEDTPQTDTDTDSQTEEAADNDAEAAEESAAEDAAEADADDSDSDSEDSDDSKDSKDSTDLNDDEVSRKINELLAEDNEKNLTPQMRRIVQREKEQSRRVEKSIEGTKTNPTWFLWIMCGLMILGLIWIVVYYLTGGEWPIPKIGNWNLLIGFGIMLVGFLMTMWWH